MTQTPFLRGAFVCPVAGLRVTGRSAGRWAASRAGQGALALRLQVAELAVQTQAAPRDDARRQRGVAVGRDVPVVGYRQLDAAAVVGVDRRRQPARACARPTAGSSATGRARMGTPWKRSTAPSATPSLAVQVQRDACRCAAARLARRACHAGSWCIRRFDGARTRVSSMKSMRCRAAAGAQAA